MKTSVTVTGGAVSRHFTLEGTMKRLSVGLIAGALASTAFAAILPFADRVKQNEVSSITQQEAEGADMSPQAAGMAANRDKALRGEPKVLTTAKEKQAVVASVTEQSIQSVNVGARSAGMNAVKDRAMKDQPKIFTTNKERQAAVQETTEQNATDH